MEKSIIVCIPSVDEWKFVLELKKFKLDAELNYYLCPKLKWVLPNHVRCEDTFE